MDLIIYYGTILKEDYKKHVGMVFIIVLLRNEKKGKNEYEKISGEITNG